MIHGDGDQRGGGDHSRCSVTRAGDETGGMNLERKEI